MEYVNWYIDSMEKGIDVASAMRDFVQVRNQCNAFEKELENTKKQKNAEISTLQKKIQMLEEELVRQKDEVNKPLINELLLLEQVNDQAKKQLENR